MEKETHKKTRIKGDMTQGKILIPMVLFTLPMMLGNLFQQLYNTVDSIIVGQYIGKQALAAVGMSFPIIFLLISLFLGVAMGGSIMVSQYFGAKDFDNLKKTVHTSITITIFIGIFTSIFGIAACKIILQALNTPADVFDMAYIYLVIIFIGIPGSLLYNIIGGILRGLGDSKSPLIFLAIASGMNIVLDILFVVAFGWGIAGVALATIISQACSAVFAFLKLQRGQSYLRMKRGDFKVDKIILKQLLRIGGPSGLQDIAFSFGMLVVQSFTNQFGSTVVAAGSAVMRVDGFVVMPMFSITAAATTFVGQNIGAGEMERVKKGVKTSMGLIIGVGGFLSLLVLTVGPSLMRLFSTDQQVLQVGGVIIRILGPFYWMMGISFLLGGILRGAGDAFFPSVISIVTMFIIRIPLTYVLAVQTENYRGIYTSMVVGIIIGAALMLIRYLSGKWKEKNVVGTKVPATNEVNFSEA